MIPDSQLDESDLEARIQKLTTSIALYSVEIDKRHDTILKQRDRIAQLEEMLDEAHTALTFYADGEHMGGHSVAMSGEPYFSVPEDGHKARASLAKIEAMRGGGE